MNADKTTREAAHRWADELQVVTDRIGLRVRLTEPRQRVAAYIQGLLSPLERKNGWQLAERAGDEAPSGVQHLLGRAAWSADEVRDDLRAYVIEHCGDPQAVLVVDETGFLKKGKQSVGVARQYSGTAGRVENCQIGVFLVYATAKGRTFLDRELYLPKEWAADETRRKAADVPLEVRFATKPQLAQRMLSRVLAADIPFGWLTGDTVYGNGWRVRAWLEAHRVNYVLGVSAQYRLFTGQEREWAPPWSAGCLMRRDTAAVVGQAVKVSASMTGCGSRCVPSQDSGNGGSWPGGASVHQQQSRTSSRRALSRRPWTNLRVWWAPAGRWKRVLRRRRGK